MGSRAKTRKHWFVFGAVCLMFMASIGLVFNTIGIYYAPVSESLNILTGTFAMNATLSAVSAAVGALFAPQIVDKIGIQKTLTLGAFCAFIGMFGMGLTKSVTVFNILGLVRGLGVAFTAMVPGVAILNNWFYEKNGLTVSLAAAGGGSSSVIMSPIFIRLIETIGWEKSFLVHGALILLLFLPALILPFTYEPEEEGLLPYGAKADLQSEATIADKLLSEPVTAKDYLGPTFYAFVTLAFVQTFAVGFGQHLPGYGASINLRPDVTGLMLSAVMFGNVTIKLVSGYLSDKVGVIKTFVIAAIVNIISIILLLILNNEMGLLFASLLFGSAYAGGVVHLLLSQHFFGVKVANYVNAYIVFAGSISTALGNTFIGYFYDFVGSYVPILWFMIGVQILALVILTIAEQSKSKSEQA